MPQHSVHVRLGTDLLAALDEWRRDQPDLPTKPEALRRTLQQAIAAREDEEADDGRREVAAA